MEPPSTARKVGTVVKAIVLTALCLLCAGQAVIMTGTKANTTFVNVAPGPGTPPPAAAAAATTTTAGRSGTTATSAAPTLPARP